MAALEGVDQSHTPQLLVLLALTMPGAHNGLLRSKCVSISKLLLQLLKSNGDAEDGGSVSILQRSLRCMGHLLAAQGTSPTVWASPDLLHSFQALLHFFADRRSKVRKAAHEAVVTILSVHGSRSQAGSKGGKRSSTGPAHYVFEFCTTVVTSCTSQDVTRALHLLQFMLLAVPLFPPHQASQLCDLMLRLLVLGSPPLTTGVTQALSAVIQSPSLCLTGPSLTKLVDELLKLQPIRSAGAGAVSFAPLLGSCMVRLQVGTMQPAPLTVGKALVGYCESSSTAVHTSSCGALNLMFQTCVDQTMVTEMARMLGHGASFSTEGGSALGDTLAALETLLQYRFQQSWPRSLPLLGRLFLHLRGASYPLLAGVLRGMGDLHDALSSVPSAALPGVTAALNEAMGFAIEGMGPERVIGLLPLAPPLPAGSNVVGEGGVSEARAWLLPLLTVHARAAPTRLAFFHSHVLAIAKQCDAAARSGRLTANEEKTQGFRVVQLWGLLPGFCAIPTDVAVAFGALAPVLANAMQDSRYPSILPIVCLGLQTLVTGVRTRAEGVGVATVDEDAASDLEALVNTSTRFLPKMFKLVDPGGARGDEGGAVASVATAGGKVFADSGAEVSLTADKITAVCDAAGALASIAPPQFLTSLFKKLIQKILQVTEKANTPLPGLPLTPAPPPLHTYQRAQVLLELAASMASSVDNECATLLYRAAKPLVRDDSSPQLQKRAYKVLLALCLHRPGFMISSERLPDVLDLFTSSLLTCHVSARQMRLQCLTHLVKTFGRGNTVHQDCIQPLILEVILCTKDSNGRTRDLAYGLLVQLAKAGGDPSKAVRIVVGALAGATPHGRSAAVMALGRLQLEFGHFRAESWDMRVVSMTPDLIQTMLVLLKEPSREVAKAVLGWLRVGVGGADREALRPLLGELVVGVMTGTTPRHKDHFRAKIRVVLSKLCRKFGFEEIKELMPEDDKKLVAHMQLVADRELKAKRLRLGLAGRVENEQGNGGVGRADSGHSRSFDAIMEDSDDEDGWDSDDDDTQGRSLRQRGAGGKGVDRGSGEAEGEMMVREYGEDGTSVVDLLDSSMVRNMRVSKRGGARDDSDSDGDDGIELATRDGKLVIPGGDSSDSDGSDGGGEVGRGSGGVHRQKKRGRDDDDSEDEDRRGGEGGGRGGLETENGFVHMAGRRAMHAASKGGMTSGPRQGGQGGAGRAVGQGRGAGNGGQGERGGSRRTAGSKKQKVARTGRGVVSGAEFRSTKAGGDVMRKGAKLEPYAYIPLDGRTLTGKRSGGEALKQYSAVVGGVGRGKNKKGRQRRGQKK
ncbi:unnamed protein product [Choristocarpus tenellus]